MKKVRVITAVLCCFVAGGAALLLLFGITSGSWSGETLSFTPSETDADGDGIDDYTDILEGARAYIATDPVYKSEYYEGGYPDDGCGVCTDVVWNALDAAGYSLKDMVDQDIAEHPEEYDIDRPDPNIDFRRVKNLCVFLERHAESLSTDMYDTEAWQGGDIVVFPKHIGIVSDKCSRNGVPLLIHHASRLQGAVEADDMEKFTVVGHYRWNIT